MTKRYVLILQNLIVFSYLNKIITFLNKAMQILSSMHQHLRDIDLLSHNDTA